MRHQPGASQPIDIVADLVDFLMNLSTRFTDVYWEVEGIERAAARKNKEGEEEPTSEDKKTGDAADKAVVLARARNESSTLSPSSLFIDLCIVAAQVRFVVKPLKKV